MEKIEPKTRGRGAPMDGLEFSETFKSLSFLKYIQEKWNLENLKNLNFNTIKKNYIAGLIGFLL